MDDIFLSLIIPAFNEEKRLGTTLASMQAYLQKQDYSWEIIVVDDGSSDRTPAIAESYMHPVPTLRLLRNEHNRGKGYSVRRGMLQGQGKYLGFADADYKTPIEEVERILPWLKDGYDMVIGSRGMERSQVERPQPKYRQVGARLFALVMHTLVGLHDIVDTQCGFKFFQRSVAQDLFSRQMISGYMFDVEVLYLAERLGYRTKEVPIRWMNDPDSRLQLVRGNLLNMRDLIRIRWNGTDRQVIMNAVGEES